jgi:hypothetical protein
MKTGLIRPPEIPTMPDIPNEAASSAPAGPPAVTPDFFEEEPSQIDNTVPTQYQSRKRDT